MTRIFVNGTGEKDDSYYSAPVTTGLSAIHFTVDSLGKAVHNFMYGGTDATVTGSPSLSSAGAIFTDNTNFIETAFTESVDMTFFIVAKLINLGTGACYFSNQGAQTGVYGTMLYATSATTLTFGSARNNGGTTNAGGVSLTGNNNAAWGLYVCTVSSAGNTIKSLTSGQANTNSVGTRSISTGKIRVGANYTSNYDGQTQCLAFVAHNALLSDTEIALWADRLRKYATARGITV